MQSRQLTARGSRGENLRPRVIGSRAVNDLGGSSSPRAVCIRVNCISIDPVFISICREFMCELSEKEHGEESRAEMEEPSWGKGTVGRERYRKQRRGMVARFTRVVSRRSLANYDSICISSNKSRLSSRLCWHTRRRVFPWILHLLTSRDVSQIPPIFSLWFNEHHSPSFLLRDVSESIKLFLSVLYLRGWELRRS